MRIAYLTQSYPPMISGAAMFACQLAEAMSQRGHQVLVIAASERETPYCVQNGNLTLFRLYSHHNPLRVGQRFLLYPRRVTLQALRDFRPDIIHTHEPLQMGNLGLEYARRMRIPITLTNHQLPWFAASYLPDKFGLRGFVENILWMYARWVLPQFTSIIAPTQTISDFITQKTNIESQTIGYGIDLDSFHPHPDLNEETATRARLNLPSNILIILHVGRLDADKSVDRVITASAQILREKDAYLVIVGDGSQKTALMKLSKSLGIADKVKFTGSISMQDGLPQIYRIASLFVTASEIETQGIVLLEAAASGLPIAAVRATCIPEIVHHGVNGYLAIPGNLNELGNNIRLILSDLLKAKIMGKESRKLVELSAAQDTMGLHEKLYLELILQTSKQVTREQNSEFEMTSGRIK